MTAYDIFNGDADGICSLIQLRLAEPRDARLVTGVKRDINLLRKIKAKKDDHLTVLDISMRTNTQGLEKALRAGAHVLYIDHHNAGDIPRHQNLHAVIDTRPIMCTSLITNTCLNNLYVEWAIVGAFGDNMAARARALAKRQNIGSNLLHKMETFGILLNYNSYGRDISDLHFAPAALFTLLHAYSTPNACLQGNPDIFQKLQNGYESDLSKAKRAHALAPQVFCLDDAPWARRVSGSFGNYLAQQEPERAHAVLTYNEQDGYTVSVRAPLEAPHGADTLCLSFPTGGGRAGAAGINHLPKDSLDAFITKFKEGF